MNWLNQNWFKLILTPIFIIMLLGGIGFVGFTYKELVYNFIYYKYVEIKLSRTEIQHDPNDLAWDKFQILNLGERLVYQWGFEDRYSYGKFMAASWFVTNDSKEAREVDIEKIIFEDQLSRSFDALNYQSDDSCGGGRVAKVLKISPGLKCHLVFLYEVPKDSEDFALEIIYRIPRALWK